MTNFVIVKQRTGNQKITAEAAKYKLGARTVKYKLGAEVIKYKLGSGAGPWNTNALQGLLTFFIAILSKLLIKYIMTFEKIAHTGF